MAGNLAVGRSEFAAAALFLEDGTQRIQGTVSMSIYQDMVVLVTPGCLASRSPQSPGDDLFVVFAATAEPCFQFLPTWRQQENADQVGTVGRRHLFPAACVEDQQHVHAAPQATFDKLPGSP